MEVSYIPSVNDYISTSLDRLTMNPAEMRKQRLWSSIFIMLYMFLCGLMSGVFLLFFVLGLILGGILYAITPAFTRHQTQKLTLKAISSSQYTGFFSERKHQLTEKTLISDTTKSRVERDLSSVVDVKELKSAVYVTFWDATELFIPNRAFNSLDEKDNFIRLLKQGSLVSN